jgi:hypothetical protein
LWLPATHKRRYHAALAVLLGIYVYDALSKLQRVEVEGEIVELLKPFGVYPWWSSRKDISPQILAPDRALAMARLNLPTGLVGLEWNDVVHPWHVSNPAQLRQDLRLYTVEVDEAVATLEAHGVRAPELRSFGKKYLDRARDSRDA